MALVRGLDAATLTALSGDNFHPILLCYVDWPAGDVRCHSGVGNISWDGQTWAGIGKLGDIELPAEGSGMISATAVISITGSIEEILAQLGVAARNRTVEIFCALVTAPAGNVLIGEPFPLFAGYIDTRAMPVSVKDGTTVEHKLQLGIKPGPGARSRGSITHTAEDQNFKYPGDTAGRHTINAVAKMQNPPTWPET